MKSQPTKQFWNCYEKLPTDVKLAAEKAFRLWLENPRHPSLHFKMLEGTDNLYSIRVGRSYRAIGLLHADVLFWKWIGHHSEYDRLTGS